jgi:hypothetical protein
MGPGINILPLNQIRISERNFFEEYTQEMIQREIEAGVEIFRENMSPFERLNHDLSAALSEQLAHEIDKEILENLRGMVGSVHHENAEIDIQMGDIVDGAIQVNAVIRPRVEYLQFDFVLQNPST